MIHARMLLVFTIAVMAFVAGCNSKPAALANVTGKVFYRGSPLQGGLIVFSPDTARGESGKIAFSKINFDGTYSLQTGDTKGASPGWFRVTIASIAGSNTSYDGPTISAIPEKYRDPQLSQLQCEVKAHIDNRLDFNLD